MTQRQSTQADELGELLDVLSHPCRRLILTRLGGPNIRDGGEVDLAELASDDELDGEALDLVHNHIPRLADAEFVDWDRERHVVTRGPRYPEIAPLIDLMVAHQDELPADWP